MHNIRVRIAIVVLVSCIGASLAGGQMRLTNGKVESASAASGLESTLRGIAGNGAGPAWIAYAYPLVDNSKPRMICCGNYSSGENNTTCCGGCALESNNYNSSSSGNCVQDSPQTQAIVFLRYSEGRVTRVRNMTPDCAVDAGGLTVHWLTDVRPQESISFLAKLGEGTNGAPEHYVTDSAIMAVALHADGAADAALNRLVAADHAEKIREKAAFWIANERGKAGFAILQKLARDDSDTSFRRKLAFDLSLTHEPEGIQELMRMVHQDADGGVRSQALFWLAQKAGKKVAAEIQNAIDNDPDTEVKKKAVFALSQLRDDEGVTRLIQVARTNRNREVRRQAIFWLGQSRDPRALAFIEEVLTK